MGKNKGAGFLIGAIVGAITGLLLAPKSGKETRGELRTQADVLAEKAKGTKDEAQVVGSRWFNKAKDVVTTAKSALEAETELEAEVKKSQAKRKAKNLGKDIKGTVKKKA